MKASAMTWKRQFSSRLDMGMAASNPKVWALAPAAMRVAETAVYSGNFHSCGDNRQRPGEAAAWVSDAAGGNSLDLDAAPDVGESVARTAATTATVAATLPAMMLWMDGVHSLVCTVGSYTRCRRELLRIYAKTSTETKCRSDNSSTDKWLRDILSNPKWSVSAMSESRSMSVIIGAGGDLQGCTKLMWASM